MQRVFRKLDHGPTAWLTTHCYRRDRYD